ncbi:alpha/beta hydrolase fold domain-containing protein [Paraburkholderia sediminicola]|uniref:alpha/beta hydrolase fold domain-containing protein n=1 Tax=Paraburkholderia sediminicola TaxID=458836 RepID=UPI0038BB8341
MEFDDPAFSIPTGAPAPLDPQMREFLRRTGEGYRRFPRCDTLPVAEARAIAETVRAPWAAGGPAMQRSDEHHVATRHGDVRVRIHYPAQRESRGALVYLHGGGFVLFSIETHDRLMREYAQRAGIAVIGVDYTRAPDARFPQALDECVDVVRWAGQQAGRLELDAAQIFIGGDSAGASLSMGAALTLRDANEPLLKGVVLNYGSFGSNLFRDSMVRYGAGDYGLSLHDIVWFRGLYLRHGRDFNDPRVNLVRADLAGLPPVCMVVAQCDPLHDDSVELERRLVSAGVEVTAKTYVGAVHSFLEAVSISALAAEAFDDTARWLRGHAPG